MLFSPVALGFAFKAFTENQPSVNLLYSFFLGPVLALISSDLQIYRWLSSRALTLKLELETKEPLLGLRRLPKLMAP